MVKDAILDVTKFVAMYGGPDSSVSPRLAWSIWTTAMSLADAYEDEEAWDLLRDELPQLAQDAADRAWMARFLLGFRAIAARITQGGRDLSRLASCTGEEMALHLVIDEAESSLAEGLLSVPELLPEDAERDDDFDWAREVMFRDHDVLLLFDPALDGVDNPASELHQRFRFANLHPSCWVGSCPSPTTRTSIRRGDAAPTLTSGSWTSGRVSRRLDGSISGRAGVGRASTWEVDWRQHGTLLLHEYGQLSGHARDRADARC